MVERSVNIRLSLRDGEVVKRALLSLGEEGQRALKRIEGGAPAVSRSLRLVNQSVSELKSGVSNWAAAAGAGGRVLAAFGPTGLAAAAALGAATIAAKQLFDATKQAVTELDALQDAADRLGIGVESLQALRFAATQLGVEVEAVDGALQKLGVTLGDVARGDNKAAAEAFKELGFSVVDASGRLKTVEEALPELADGFAKVTDQTTRLSLAQDIFGRGGAEFVTVLQNGSDALEAAMQKARDMGAVIDEELVKKGAAAKDELEALSMVINAQLNSALVDLGPEIVKFVQLLAEAAKWAGELVDSFRDLDNRRLGTIMSRAEELRNNIADARRRDPTGMIIGTAQAEAELAELEAEIERRQIVADDLAKMDRLLGRKRGAGIVDPEADKAAAEAAKLEAQAYANVMKEGAAVFAATRTEVEKYAIEVERLNGLLAAGAIDQDTYNRAVEAAREPLRKQAEEQRKAAEEARKAADEARKAAFDARTDAMAGVERALSGLRKEALDDAAIIEEGFVSIWESAEDALTEFVKTGKLDLESLEMTARDIAAKLAVHFLKQAIFMGMGLGAVPALGGTMPAPGAGLSSGFVPAIVGALTKSSAFSTAGASASGSVQSQIWSFFAGKGLPAHQIAGIMGNIAGESGYSANPPGYNDAGMAYGLFQHYGPRKTGLFNFAGTNSPSVQQQLEFAWSEMQGNSRYRSVLGAGSVEEATRLFGRDFEAPKDLDASINKRIAAAKQAIAEHGETIASATGDVATNLEATAEATGKIGQQFSVKFAGGLEKTLSGLGGLGGSGGGGSFFSFLTGFAGLGGLGPMTRPHGYYAKGDVFDSPRVFPMAKGWGLMAEAGPEAVMPLRRTRNGDLGVILARDGGGGAPAMSVQVINYMGGEAQVETRQTKRDDGSPGLDVIFKAAIDRRNSETLPGILGTGYATPKELRMR